MAALVGSIQNAAVVGEEFNILFGVTTTNYETSEETEVEPDFPTAAHV